MTQPDQSESAHHRAVNALYAFARERWGWGSDEYADVADAVEVVIEALSAKVAFDEDRNEPDRDRSRHVN